MRQIPITASAASPKRSARRLRAVFAPLALSVAAATLPVAAAAATAPAPAPTDRSAEHWCAAELDAAVATARRGVLDAARDALDALGPQCTGLPQIEHDLGVIALRAGDHDAAVRHLERALEIDERVARTVRALREVRRWRAGLAWRDALGETGTGRGAPALELLGSDATGASERLEAGRDALLRDETTLAYELYAWWDTLRRGDADAVRSHYAGDAVRAVGGSIPAAGGGSDGGADAGPPGRLPGRLPDWDDVERELAFTARDAVAVLRWRDGEASAGRLLLLRAVDDRWLIYRESPL